MEEVQPSRAWLRIGLKGRREHVPLRQLECLARLPGGIPAPQRISDSPWQLSQQALQSSRPRLRDWGAAWVLLIDSGESSDLEGFAELVCGDRSAASLAACWSELAGAQQLFRWRKGQVEPRSLADLRPLRHQRRLQALQRQRESQWQELLRRREPVDLDQLSADHQQRLMTLQQVAAGTLAPQALEAALQRSLSDLRLGHSQGDLRHLLVDLGLWNPHQLASITGTPWSHGFSAELLQESQRLLALSETVLPGDETRVDLTSHHAMTIDDPDTCDIDDGLSLERHSGGGLRLWIHVADPDRLIHPGSPLDLEAQRRGSSLYLAGGSLPMLPEALATGPLSLRAGVRTAAWSTWVELNETGEISACGLERSWVTPAYRLTYEDADTLIDLAPPEERDLAEMAQLLERRRRWRLSQGALLLDLPEGRIRCRDGQPQLEITEPGPSRQLVAEAMILAGSVAARLGRDQGVALPYRSQLPALLPAAAELAALPEGPVRYAAIRRCLSRGLLGTEPAPHFSLGLPMYVQATSPIRRYGDLLVQRQLGAASHGTAPLGPAELGEVLTVLERSIREGIAITREDQRHWQQVWFEAHRHQEWHADFLRWLRPQDRLGLVRIEDLAMELAADCPADATPGDSLRLRVLEVDSLRDQLRLVAAAL